MNERLQELLEQASEVHDYWYRGDSQRLVDHKMFAELIVRECISCLNDGAKQAGDVRTTVGTVEKTLKQHFGLET